MYHFILFQPYKFKSTYAHSFLYYIALSVWHKIIDLKFIYLFIYSFTHPQCSIL
jgi:hypothetical protein